MRKFRYLIRALSSIVLICCFLINLAGCNSSNNSTDNNITTQEQTEKLYLNNYSITLYEGETYNLQLKKKDANGELKDINNILYSSDRDYIANCENGVITALSAGKTYIHIEADGLSTSIFVNVESLKKKQDMFIRFVEEQLYLGISVYGHVYKVENNKVVEVSDVTWSTNSPALSINDRGLVTPTQKTNNATINAYFNIDGKEYKLEKQVSVVDALYYSVSKNEVFLASKRTYTGENNNKYISSTIVINELNLSTEEEKQLLGDKFTIDSEETSLFSYKIEPNGNLTFTSSDKVGKANLMLRIIESPRSIQININVAYAVATIEDMDKLSLASCNKTEDLSSSYILVNDIDYNNEVIYPIAVWRENENRTLGKQWKYLLNYEDGKYDYVDRNNVGKSGEGLSDDEWVELSNAKGINASNLSFSGIFDGNGYAIKNAKLMYAPFITSPQSSVYSGAGSSIFGYVINGTLRNIEFDITLQTISDIQTKFGNDLSETVINGSIINFEWDKSEDKYLYFSSTIIYRAKNTTISNVFSHITLPSSEMNTSRNTSAILGWADGTTAYNNIIYIENNTNQSSYYGIQAEGNVKLLEKNIAIGTSRMCMGYSEAYCGTSGNWWMSKTNFSELNLLESGNLAVNIVSLQDTLTSFNNAIWDISLLNSNTPILLDGCSVS